MLLEQTIEKLQAMKLKGMVSALEQWSERGNGGELDPADLVGLLADAEWIHRQNRRYVQRLRQARFAEAASVEEIDYRHPRGLEKSKMLELVSCRWIGAHQNLIITGPTGIGKTFLPCALGEKACREGYKVAYSPPEVLPELGSWGGQLASALRLLRSLRLDFMLRNI